MKTIGIIFGLGAFLIWLAWGYSAIHVLTNPSEALPTEVVGLINFVGTTVTFLLLIGLKELRKQF